MNKAYKIILDGQEIGTSLLEKADAPMGVVFGVIRFVNQDFGYDFFKNYCISNGIELASDYPEDKLMSTRTIESLLILNGSGKEIKGIGNQITGMDGEDFEIAIEGIPYPFYEEEFPHHRKAYDEMFKE
jgi:hypothetical protein